jgi:predicted nucleic acid-binding protein
MDAFVQLPIDQETWDHLGRHLASLRANGLRIPFQDALLATVAIDHAADLWSYDGHFRAIQPILTDLRLFDGPEV